MKAPEIKNPSGFINTNEISIGEFKDKKVVLIDFWTYSCINCQRTLSYIEGWYQKYKHKGLVIIGIHTPEFEFEKNYENVKNAVKQFNLTYPVVLDNDYATWNEFSNRYWPRKYLIDIEGNIVYDHIGEGGYAETEQAIQQALKERAQKLGEDSKIDGSIFQPKNAEEVDLSEQRSPEVYFGSDRNTLLGNGKSNEQGPQTLEEPGGIKTNILYLVGEWNFQSEYAESKSKGKIIFRYQAKKAHMVASSGQEMKIRVTNDGKPANTRDASNGEVNVKEEQLYRLVENDKHGEHTLEIDIEEPGFKIFTFTFG